MFKSTLIIETLSSPYISVHYHPTIDTPLIILNILNWYYSSINSRYFKWTDNINNELVTVIIDRDKIINIIHTIEELNIDNVYVKQYINYNQFLNDVLYSNDIECIKKMLSHWNRIETYLLNDKRSYFIINTEKMVSDIGENYKLKYNHCCVKYNNNCNTCPIYIYSPKCIIKSLSINDNILNKKLLPMISSIQQNLKEVLEIIPKNIMVYTVSKLYKMFFTKRIHS